jgi:hypothetical protein
VTAITRPGIREPDPLGPMLQRGTITTLVGPVDSELAALIAALAVSYKTGVPLISGFVPEWPGEVTAYCYEYSEIAWKSLASNICAVAGIQQPPPVITFQCPREPLVGRTAVESDPDGVEYWDAYVEMDIPALNSAAFAAGRRLPDHLYIVFGVRDAAGDGGEGTMRQLYDKFRGDTVLMAGLDAADDMAASYGPVIELPNLHNSVR